MHFKLYILLYLYTLYPNNILYALDVLIYLKYMINCFTTLYNVLNQFQTTSKICNFFYLFKRKERFIKDEREGEGEVLLNIFDGIPELCWIMLECWAESNLDKWSRSWEYFRLSFLNLCFQFESVYGYHVE